jgi:hypothetical protein
MMETTFGFDRAVLYALVGQTDLKVLATDRSGTRLLAEVLPAGRPEVGTRLRDFHLDVRRDIESGGGTSGVRYAIRDEIAQDVPEDPAGRPLKGAERTEIRWSAADGFKVGPNGLAPLLDDAGRTVLVPAKLGPVVRSLLRQGPRVEAVVVFATHRAADLGKFTDGEPVAAGPVLARWLADVFGLRAGIAEGDIGPGAAGWVDFLVGAEELYGGGRDFPVTRAGVARIDGAVRRTRAALSVGAGALVSVGGGPSEFKEVVRSAVRLHFGGERTFDWHPVEGATGDATADWSGMRLATPVESFRVRENAMAQLRRGDLVGAHAIARHLDGDPLERPWVDVLAAAADYMSGVLPRHGSIPDAAGTAPADRPLPRAITRLLADDVPDCLHVAFRVEAALLGGRVPEALAATTAFLDAAIADGVARLPGFVRFDPKGWTVWFARDAEIEADLFVAKEGKGIAPLTPKSNFDDATGKAYGYGSLGASKSQWITALDRRFAKGSRPLWSFEQAFMKKLSDTDIEIRVLRNRISHGLPDPALMRAAMADIIAADLWAAVGAGEPGSRCLARPLFRDVLAMFGVRSPDRAFHDLIEGLVAEILDHRMAHAD